MKLRLLAILLFLANTLFSQNFHDTQGKLEISSSGQSTYTLPVIMPPSLKDVMPVINLVYTSGQMGGVAGQGWNISSVSNISRMANRKDIDGFVDGVDFDDNDKLSFDGQRLILKTGVYWADGSTYETEVHSNSKIELKGAGTTMYFIVTAPDGSRSWYGNYGGVNATDITAFYIVRFEDMHGNYMTYHYSNPFAKSLCLSEIKFSANNAGLSPINRVIFNYKQANRSENAYIDGIKLEKVALLDFIEVKTNDQLFRKYQLTHTMDEFGYDRLTQLQEFNGALEPANPVVFEYMNTSGGGQIIENNYFNNLNFESVKLSGDFDGDGRLDFVANNALYTNLFQGLTAAAPITLPFTFQEGKTFAATTLTNNKLNQNQSIVRSRVTANGVVFDVYNKIGNSIVLSYSKTANFTLTAAEVSNNGANTNVLEGDFNGDGISEVLIASYPLAHVDTDPSSWCNLMNPPGCTYCMPCNVIDQFNFYLFDLNQNTPSVVGSSGLVRFNIPATQTNFPLVFGPYKPKGTYVMDFNGDGKADIMNIGGPSSGINGYYTIYSLKETGVNSVIDFEIIGEGTLSNFDEDKPLLFGDYNGDGKVDIMIPAGVGSPYWTIYYAKPKQVLANTLNSFFESTSVLSTLYHPTQIGQTYQDWTNYYAIDINKDGKSDLVSVYRNYHKPGWTINNHDTSWRVQGFTNDVARSGQFNYSYESGLRESYSPEIPIPVVSNYRDKGLNTDLVIVRGHVKKVEFYKFNKDVSQDNLLKKVSVSGGNIVDEISYQTMDPLTTPADGLGTLNSFYSSSNSVNYPNVEIKRLSNNLLVSKLKNTTEGVVSTQDFRYHGLVVNLHGIGSIGFNKTARSNWYKNEADKRIWSVTELNPLWRGAVSRSYTKLFAQGNSFAFAPSNFTLGLNGNIGEINGTVNNFIANTINNIFRIYLDNQKTVDIITGVSNETSYTYDPTYLLISKTISKNYLNGGLQGTTTVSTVFDNSVVIGRPKSNKTVIDAYLNTFETSKEFEYTNNFLTKIKKKGNTTDNKYIVEAFEYNNYGNVTKKTISSEGYSGAIINPRSTEFTYDLSQRFVTFTQDAEGLISTNDTFDPLYGVVLSSTNPFGLKTDSKIDGWGKSLKITDCLGKSVTHTYTKLGSEYTVTTTGDDGSVSISITDVLGRSKKSGVKNIDNSWSYKNIEYDFLGRKFRDSEPYAEGGPSLWNTTTYDDYNRVLTTVTASGLTTGILYSGLTTTANDGTKTTSSTKNANGHVVSATDNGGTINYTYFANGNLKTSDFEGTIISTEYDEWGNKTKLTDPSAGVYEYTYYPTGETLSEKTPNGTTTYLLDTVTAKLSEKTITGNLTNSTATYNYDGYSKLLIGIGFNDSEEGLHTDYTFEYDNFLRITKKTEKNDQSYFSHETFYDDFGRSNKEIYSGTVDGRSSTKSIINTYKNGGHWQILDESSNQILWQTNTVTARGQLATGAFGNGLNQNNVYDNYGFPLDFNTNRNIPAAKTNVKKSGSTQRVENPTDPNPDPGPVDPVDPGPVDPGPVDPVDPDPVDPNPTESVIDLTYSFNPQKGNLDNRSNSLFNIYETFQYDNLDRLVEWGAEPVVLHTNVFTDGVDGFVGIVGGSVTNLSGKLKVNATGSQSGTQKIIMTNASLGNKLNIKATVNKGTTNKIRVVIVERDALTGTSVQRVLGLANEGAFISDYVVLSNNCTVYLRFDKSESSTDVGTLTNFMIDNVTVTKINKETQQYDNKGRITQNKIGDYNYTNTDKKYQNTSVLVTPEASNYYNTRPLQNVSYNAFKSPVKIEEEGIDIVNFAYNAFNGRSAMYYGGLQSDKLERPLRKYYSSDGTIEVKYNRDSGNMEFITYIGGNGYSAPIVFKSNGDTEEYLYLHRDNQGSIIAVSNDAGELKEIRRFDAWGNVLRVLDEEGNDLDGLRILDRGYTGHEHLQSVGLIHMNGRLFDPKLHRFLQPDNFVQDPYNTQNYNRYGYVLNNPLKYTDPSGEYGVGAAVLIGAVIAATTYTLVALTTDTPFSVGGIVKATFIGALTSYVTFGIGPTVSTVNSVSSTATGFWAGAAQGAVQGAFTGVTGVFWDAALKGGSITLGQLFKSGLMSAAVGGAIGGVRGGIKANKSGLKFWSGTGTLETPFDNSYANVGGTEKPEYSNEYAQNFSDSNPELNKLSENVDNLYADGSVPENGLYSLDSNGNIMRTGGLSAGKQPYLVNGVTNIEKGGAFGLFNKMNVYLSKTSFVSTAQLYVTMGHEYMHAFFTLNTSFDVDEQHRLIHQWAWDQANAWGPGVLNKSYYGGNFIHDNAYQKYGFKIINYKP